GLAVTINLGNAQKATEFVNATFGTDSPFRDLTLVGTGRVEARVTKRGESDFEGTVSFLTDLSGTVTDNNGFSRSASSPARTPAFSARIDRPTLALTASL